MLHWRGFEKKQSWLIVVVVLYGKFSRGIAENHKDLSQDTMYLGRDLNRALPEHKRHRTQIRSAASLSLHQSVTKGTTSKQR
jgi:hypothetical protein